LIFQAVRFHTAVYLTGRNVLILLVFFERGKYNETSERIAVGVIHRAWI